MIEELKQRIVATSSKLRKYEARTEQYVQNRMFQTNQAKLFERLEKENGSNDIRPGNQESVRFWSEIWDQSITHNDEAKWLKKVERKLRGTAKLENITITTDKLKKQSRRVKTRKAPGPDGLQGYWIRTFTSCHERNATQLQLCFEMNVTRDWLTTGKTVIIMKGRGGMMSPTLDQ